MAASLYCALQPPNSYGIKLAGQEGFEPPASGFGDRRSTSWSYWPALGEFFNCNVPSLFCLFMNGVMPAAAAKLLRLETLGLFLLIFGR